MTAVTIDDKPTCNEDLFSEVNLNDSFSLCERIRKIGPVVWFPKNKTYVVTDKSVVEELLLRAGDFSAANSAYGNDVMNNIKAFQEDIGDTEPVELLFTMDGSEHTKKKKLITGAFKLDQIDKKWRPRAVEIVEEQLDYAKKKRLSGYHG